MRRESNKYIFAPNMRHQKRRGNLRFLLLFFVLLLAAVAVLDFISVKQVRLENRTVTVLNLPSDLERYSILHISDLHGAELGKRQAAVANALGNVRYSCAVMTGDMLGENHDTSALLDLIALMPADTLKIMIPGDEDGPFITETAHGSLSVYTEWAQELMDAGIILLDEPLQVVRNKSTVWFVPEELYTLDISELETVYTRQLQDMAERATSLTADDAARKRALEYQQERIARIREKKAMMTASDIQVVLTHTPLQEDYVRDMIGWSGKEDCFSLRYASLFLAGHYCGGQWRLPFGPAIWVPELDWFPKDTEVQGLSYLYAIPQYISPGLGARRDIQWQPGRFFNSPVITLLTLTGKTV